MVWIGVLLSLALGIAPLQGRPGDTKDGQLLDGCLKKEFRLIEGEMTWKEARKRCYQINNPSLRDHWIRASLPTNEIFDEIAGKVQNLLSGSNCSDTWVGLRRSWNGDKWYWPSQASISSNDKRWAKGEPNEDRAADVAFIRSDRQGSKSGKLMSSKRESKRCSVLCIKW